MKEEPGFVGFFTIKSLGSAQKLFGILSAKCSVFWGLLPTAYAKLFLYDPLTRFCFLTTLLLNVFLWLSLSLNAQQVKENEMEIYVGSCHLEVVDEIKGIRFPLFLMYPTHVPSNPTKVGPFSITATANAPLGSGQYPLVVISHGSGGTHLGYLTIAQYLAEQGYIVAMPEHHGNNRNDNHLFGTKDNLENRPRHIGLVIDSVSSDSRFQNHVQKNNTAIIGHSMGGYTALAVAGGSPWTESGEKVRVIPDSRVKALVLMTPATIWYTPDNSLANVKVPIMMLIAEHDPYTPRAFSDLVLRQIQDSSKINFRVVENAGHFSFMSPFPVFMSHPDFLPSTDPEGFDREAFHQLLKKDILAFLNDVFHGPDFK